MMLCFVNRRAASSIIEIDDGLYLAIIEYQKTGCQHIPIGDLGGLI